MLAVLVIGGVQLVIGVLGEYLWRILDEARERPLYIIERTAGSSRPSSSLPDAVGTAARSSR